MNVSSREIFLRNIGALGLTGASSLGFSIAAPAAANALRPPRDVIAAGGGATVRIGHVGGFTGVYAKEEAQQHVGLQVAVDEAMRKNSRIQYVIVTGDDTAKPEVGAREATRLVTQQKADVLTGCSSSAVGLAVSKAAEGLETLFVAIGTSDNKITGSLAHRVTFRQQCANRMLVQAVAPALLTKGKNWFFVTADYTFGRDAQAGFASVLTAHGGTVVGNALHPLGLEDFKPWAQQNLANVKANVLVFCNLGADTRKSVQAAVDLGLQRSMQFGGIHCGNEVADQMPADDIVGSTWGYIWGPDAGGKTTAQLYSLLKKAAPEVSGRHYLGYMAGKNMIAAMNEAGSTDTERLIHAMEGLKYDAAKYQSAYFRKCDHQAIQQTYAAEILPKAKRIASGEFFAIRNSVSGEVADADCSFPENAAATRIFGQEGHFHSNRPVVNLR